jgi:SAM-dependent methyltransferase
MAIVDEHFVPETGKTVLDYLRRGDTTAVHHLIRYDWACAALAELGDFQSLLDIACGVGFGSHRLAREFPLADVAGADNDEGAISFARKRYDAGNLIFSIGDLLRWDESLGGARYDRIVCFDTIEHIAHREVMMKNVVDHLQPDGILLLSTPVRGELVLHPHWEHHRVEYSPDVLYDFMSRYFGEIIHPDDASFPRADVFDEVNENEVVYLLKMNPLVCRKPLSRGSR